MDTEHNFVIVKCTLYFGGDPALSTRRIEALKSGLLSALDKVETAAKARCARDIGCGTEYALDFEPEEEIAEVVTSGVVSEPESRPVQAEKPQEKTGVELEQAIRDKLNDLYPRAKKLKLCNSNQQFIMYIRRVLDNPHLDLKYVRLENLSRVEDDIVTHEMAQALEEQKAS
jgi:hypothetical protein